MSNISINVLDLCGLCTVMEALPIPSLKHQGSRRFEFDPVQFDEWKDSYTLLYNYKDRIDKRDLEFASSLMKADGQCFQALKGIIVYLKIDAPIYWFYELGSYSEGLTQLSLLNVVPTFSKNENMRTAVFMVSYPTLSKMYHDHKNDPSLEWKGFCKRIEGLPFADKLITGPFEPIE